MKWKHYVWMLSTCISLSGVSYYGTNYKLNSTTSKSKDNIFNVSREVFNFKSDLNAELDVKDPSIDSKLILFWTEFFSEPFSFPNLHMCPDVNCTFTNDRSQVDNASAVVFHMRDFSWNDVPVNRAKHQSYVFYLLESPPHTPLYLDEIPNFFNWTMTYRTDSDFPSYYGLLQKKQDLNINSDKPPIALNATEILGKNKKMVAWMVSNCWTPSKRELYVKNLQNYIQVDIYGHCGNMSCPKSLWSQCNTMIGDNYKFYLAFENSICKDYITEKFYDRALINSVAIVLKRNIVQNLLPENSFIAADDFNSPKELAEYLAYLSNNDEKYLNYFKWRTLGYEYLTDLGRYSYCSLCKKLWNQSEPEKYYSNMSSWWRDNVCDVTFVNKQIQ